MTPSAGIERKRCPDCGETKALDEFYRNRSTRDGRHTYCKPCYAARARAQHAKVGRRYHRTSRLRRAYGITSDDYDRMLEEQGGVCAICSSAEENGNPLSVDHDHVDGRVRGLLCNRCNRGLGLFLDRPESLRSAAEYLERT